MKEKLTEKLREVNLDLKKFPHLKGLNLANGICEWAKVGSNPWSKCTKKPILNGGYLKSENSLLDTSGCMSKV